MATAPPIYVSAPATVASRYGILSAADVVSITDPHMRNGVEYQTAPEGPVKLASAECTPAGGSARTAPDGLPVTEAGPIVVYNGFTCRAVGLSEQQMLDNAREALLGGEAAAVEKAIWDSADPLRLMETGLTDVLTTTPQSVVSGIALLEQHLHASSVGVGVIHAPRQVAPFAAQQRQIESESGRKVTTLGTRVSFGNYPATKVDGSPAAAGTVWLVATGPVTVRRSEVSFRPGSMAEAIDWRRTDDVFSIAERTYVVSWDDRVRAAVPINLPTT